MKVVQNKKKMEKNKNTDIRNSTSFPLSTHFFFLFLLSQGIWLEHCHPCLAQSLARALKNAKNWCVVWLLWFFYMHLSLHLFISLYSNSLIFVRSVFVFIYVCSPRCLPVYKELPRYSLVLLCKCVYSTSLAFYLFIIIVF